MAEASAELAARREAIEQGLSTQAVPPGVFVERIEEDGFQGLRLVPQAVRSDCVILHFHGGGFRVGSAAGWTPFGSRLASVTGRECILVDYPLAPESPFPLALESGVSAYRWLAGRGVPVVLSGDSAGGGLAASLALTIADGGLSLHGGLVLYSPWLDLRVINSSFEENETFDYHFSRQAAEEAVAVYAGGIDVTDPRVSPVLGDWRDHPPVMLETSGSEVLRDDSRNLAGALVNANVPLWYREVPGEPHDWPVVDPCSAASRQTLRLTADFLDSLTSDPERLTRGNEPRTSDNVRKQAS